MAVQPVGYQFANRAGRLGSRHMEARALPLGNSSPGGELHLKILIILLFLPEGFSFFIGDFRLSPVRVWLMICLVMVIAGMAKRSATYGLVRVPSDKIVWIAAGWMILAGTVTGGGAGLKGAGISALEFAGTYTVFRYFGSPADHADRVVALACKILFIIVGLAVLDPLTGKLFTYEAVKGLTGYAKPVYEAAMAVKAETLFRNGTIRAMGPLEHSILFGSVCAWLGLLGFIVFPRRLLGWASLVAALVGIVISQARAPLLAFVIGILLILYYSATKSFALRWKLLGGVVFTLLIVIFMFSGSPIATLMRLGGISPEAAWYRQAIWETAVPIVQGAPVFGIGVTPDWDWQANPALVGPSVDAFWLLAAMMYGLPGAILIVLTLLGAYWTAALDQSVYLSAAERRLAIALGIITTTIVFLGFTVAFWGITWIMLGMFPALRASIAEAAALRRRAGLSLASGTGAGLRRSRGSG